MPRKCSIGFCRTNYDSNIEREPPVTIHGFPSDEGELEKWLAALPYKVAKESIASNMGVCSRHWPNGVEIKRIKGQSKPAVPPTIFPIGAELYKPCTSKTKRLNTVPKRSSKQVVIPEEYGEFDQNDKVPETLPTLADWLKSKDLIQKYEICYFIKNINLHLLKFNSDYSFIQYSIHINEKYHVTAKKSTVDVRIKDILKTNEKLTTWPQLNIMILVLEALLDQ